MNFAEYHSKYCMNWIEISASPFIIYCIIYSRYYEMLVIIVHTVHP